MQDFGLICIYLHELPPEGKNQGIFSREADFEETWQES